MGGRDPQSGTTAAQFDSLSVSVSGSETKPYGGSLNVLEPDSDTDSDPDCRRQIYIKVC
ncbi:hypothetical protein JCM31598_12250 [Desulfonatronum parangueonense]